MRERTRRTYNTNGVTPLGPYSQFGFYYDSQHYDLKVEYFRDESLIIHINDVYELDLKAGTKRITKEFLASKPLKYTLKELQIPVSFGYDLE